MSDRRREESGRQDDRPDRDDAADAPVRVIGTRGDDTITAGDPPEVSPGVRGLPSLDGPNLILGRGGDDELTGGGLTPDRILGGAGDDRIFAGFRISPAAEEVSDTLIGGAGDDFLFGWIGADRLSGGSGADTLIGGDLEIESGGDHLAGGAGNDLLDGAKGADTLHGGAGEDIFRFEIGVTGPAPSSTTRPGAGNRDVILDFRQGTDVIDLSTWQTFFRPARDNPENSFLGSCAFRDVEDLELRTEIQGDRTIVQIRSATNETWFLPTLGEIELKGRFHLTAADFFLGQPGEGGDPGGDPPVPPDDAPGAILGTDGDDSLDGTAESDLILGRAGDDTLAGTPDSAADTLFGEAGDDTLIGGPLSDDRLFGGPGADTLRGGDQPFLNARDHLSGGDGNDLLYGSPGDTLRGGEGEDTFLFATSFRDGYFPASPAGPDTRNVILDFEQGRDRMEFFFKNDSVQEEPVFLGMGEFTPREPPAQIRYEIRGDSTFVETFEPFREEVIGGTLLVTRPTIRQEIELKGRYDLTAADFGLRDDGDTGQPGEGGDPGDDGPPVPPEGTPGVILGTPGNDTLVGAAPIFGLEGNDVLISPLFDTGNVEAGPATLVGGPGNDGLSGGRFADRLFGGDGNDRLSAGDLEFGGGGDDLSGGSGDDTLGAAFGTDRMIGGAGEDCFFFPLGVQGPVPRSTTSVGDGRDVILDFEQGRDVIDLSEYQRIALAAREGSQGSFIGTDPFGDSDDLQVRYEVRGDATIVQFRSAFDPVFIPYLPFDGEIGLRGRYALTADDFILSG